MSAERFPDRPFRRRQAHGCRCTSIGRTGASLEAELTERVSPQRGAGHTTPARSSAPGVPRSLVAPYGDTLGFVDALTVDRLAESLQSATEGERREQEPDPADRHPGDHVGEPVHPEEGT